MKKSNCLLEIATGKVKEMSVLVRNKNLIIKSQLKSQHST